MGHGPYAHIKLNFLTSAIARLGINLAVKKKEGYLGALVGALVRGPVVGVLVDFQALEEDVHQRMSCIPRTAANWATMIFPIM